MSNKIPYSQLCTILKTGDILTFSGNSPLDWIIRIMEGEPYTHAGMVILDGGTRYFWDAPGGGNQFPDPYKSNSAHDGCRVAKLDDIMKYYMSPGNETNVYWRQLSPAVTPTQQAMLRTFIDLADGLPFPELEDVSILKSWLESKHPSLDIGGGLLASYLAGKELYATIAGNFFCAHLVAESYMRMGLLPIEPRPANGYSPADFNSTDPKVLPLLGCTLTPTQEVSYP